MSTYGHFCAHFKNLKSEKFYLISLTRYRTPKTDVYRTRRCFRNFQGHAMRKRSVALPSNYRYVMSSHSCASLCNYKSRTHHIKKWRALKVGPPEILPQKAPSTGGWNPPWTVNHIFETFIIWTCWYNLHPGQKSTLAQTSFMVKEVAQNGCILP